MPIKLFGMVIWSMVVYFKANVPVAQWLTHCVSSTKVVGSIPKEYTY